MPTIARDGSGTAARSTPPIAASRGSRRPARYPLFGFLCILPAFLFAIVFLYYPALSAIFHAFTEWDGATAPTFVGLGNFQQMVSDPQTRASFGNVLLITGFSLVIELVVPLAVAKMILALRRRGLQHAIRVLFLIPLVVPQVIIYLLWQFIYDPNIGLLNALLSAAHTGVQPDWLGDPRLALYSIMVTGAGVIAPFPFVDGFGLLIYTAGLQAIPQEVIESAHLDGAGAWARFWRIEVPLILGQLRLMSILTIVASIQQFTAVLILTGGGPGFSTYVPGLSMYNNAFYFGRMGYACAIGTALFLVILVLTVLNLRYVRSATDFNADAAV